jgi:hypothetical protein
MKGGDMNLTPEQVQALVEGEIVAVTVGDTRCVVIREDLFRDELDDSAWTEVEMNLLADEANEIISRAEVDAD